MPWRDGIESAYKRMNNTNDATLVGLTAILNALRQLHPEPEAEDAYVWRTRIQGRHMRDLLLDIPVEDLLDPDTLYEIVVRRAR